MENTFERFMADNPELKLVDNCPDKDLLVWADKKKYIVLRQAEGKKLYTDFQLGVAKMWAEKDDSAKLAIRPWKLMVKYKDKGDGFHCYDRFSTEEEAQMAAAIILEKNPRVVASRVAKI